MENGTAAAPLGMTTNRDDYIATEITLILRPCMEMLDQYNNTVGHGISGNLEIANVIGYTILALSIVGNIAVFIGMPFKINERNKLCTLHILVRHLVRADLLVTCFFLPKQMNWINMGNFTYGGSFSWIVADGACRTVAFFSSLGQYSSGFLIVSITLDRCLAVRKQTIASKAVQRATKMAWAAWAGSFIFAGIEAGIYHLEYPRLGKEWKKCTFVGTFQSFEFEFAYVTIERALTFGFPFLMILICYPCMLWETCRVPLDNLSRNARTIGGRRAGRRTKKVSVTVVFLFFICWAPYNLMYLWAFVDRRFYFKVPPNVQIIMRLLACANSCLNPIVYGYYYIVK